MFKEKLLYKIKNTLEKKNINFSTLKDIKYLDQFDLD